MDDRQLARALDVNWRNLALGHETFEAEGATFVRDTRFPHIYDANFIYNATASTADATASLLQRAEREYAHAAAITFRTDARTPAALLARLALDGYDASDSLLLLLDGPLSGPPRASEIRAVDGEGMWEAYRDLKRADWREHAARVNADPGDTTIADGLADSNRTKAPPVRYFMAYEDGAPRAFFSAWEGDGGIGQVEHLYTHPEYRHRGLATALIHHCVADARAHGAGPIVIVCDPADTPKQMYTALGWRPLALNRQFTKKRA